MDNLDGVNKNISDTLMERVFIRIFWLLGITSIFAAFVVPIKLRHYYKPLTKDYKTIADISGVGDFIGGTTVAFLTAASVFLLLATIIMQRKEIKISQQGIEQLVIQTKASVKQAEEARKETAIANQTMKKQSFDSTFFNMINLHQSILNQVKIQDGVDFSEGREAFQELYEKLKKDVIEKKPNIIKEVFHEHLYNPKKRISLITKSFLESDANQKSGLVEILKEKIDEAEYFESFFNNENCKNLLKPLIDDFEKHKSLLDDDSNNLYIFNFLKNSNLLPEDVNAIWKQREEIFKKLPLDFKKKLCGKFYEEKEPIIGHYYRNLYRIMKYIQEYQFSDDDQVNQKERKEYRGILRAQLSSYELLMLFYNICYSEKGEKFKDILKDTNFFDNHLVEADFIWENDSEELKYFKK